MMPRSTIAIMAGVLNEADKLPEFLKKHSWADEIVILDSGSTDGSLEICRQANCHIISRDHFGNHNERFAYAIKQIASDWIFVADPDEYITDELKFEVQEVLAKGTPHSAFKSMRVNFFIGAPLRSKAFSSDVLKFFRRDKVDMIGTGYHDEIKVNGTIGRLNGEHFHFPNTNIHWMVNKHNYISEFDKKGYFDKFGVMTQKQFVWFVITRPLKTFYKNYIKKQGYKDGVYGFVYSLLIWADDMTRICKYWEQYIVKNPDVYARERLPDPWKTRK